MAFSFPGLACRYDGSTWLNDMYEYDFERRIWGPTSVQGSASLPDQRKLPAEHAAGIWRVVCAEPGGKYPQTA